MFGMMEMFSMSMSSEKWVLAKWIGQILKPDWVSKPTAKTMKAEIFKSIQDKPLEQKVSCAHKLDETWKARRRYAHLRPDCQIIGEL